MEDASICDADDGTVVHLRSIVASNEEECYGNEDSSPLKRPKLAMRRRTQMKKLVLF